MAGLPGNSAWVKVGPPLSANCPSSRMAPKGRLLMPESVKPALLPMAQKLALTVPVLSRSGPLALLLPERIVLASVMVALLRPWRAIPPPPVPDVEPFAVLPEIVLFCTSRVPVVVWRALLSRTMPAPEIAAVLWAVVVLRIRRALGPNPWGGEGLKGPKKSMPPPPTLPLDVLPETVLFSSTREPV